MTVQTYPATPDGLTAALTALGANAIEVAETLRRNGYVGIPSDESSCPVARYLHDAIPQADEVYAGVARPGEQVQHAAIRLANATGWVDIQMPKGPAAFVIAFDHGYFNGMSRDWDDPDDGEDARG